MVSAILGSTSEVLLLFSGDVTVNVGVFPDAALMVSGFGPTSASQVAPTVVRVQFISTLFPGAPWSLSAQPNWLATAIDVPAGGNLA